MEHQDAFCFESSAEAYYEQPTNHPYISFADDDDVQSDNWIMARDVLQGEECFILGKEFITQEEEYVMWEEAAPGGLKQKDECFRDVFEEESALPEDDSLHYMDQYFRLKTTVRQTY